MVTNSCHGGGGRGFAISSMLYTILLLFLLLLIGILGILGTRKVILDRMKNEIASNLNENNDIYLKLEYEDLLVANTSMVDDFSFDPLDIVSVVDKTGNLISTASISYNSKPNFDSTQNGLYTITYTGTYQAKTVSKTTTIEVINPVSYDYDSTGTEQNFKVPAKGLYRMELWGASGNLQKKDIASAGRGAYTRGDIVLEKEISLFVYVGNKGFNAYPGSIKGYAGGGATDIRLIGGTWYSFDSLKSRIMVAGGGGGSEWAYSIGGDAGGLEGLNGYGTTSYMPPGETNYGIIATGGTQTRGGLYQTDSSTSHTKGNNGSFGISGHDTTSEDYGGAGGGGYYGGAGRDYTYAGGGGSSFISGHPGCNAITETSTETNIVHTGNPNHYSGYIFTNTVMKAGNEVMPSYDHMSTMTGNNGNGHAKVTPLVIENVVTASNLVNNSGFESDLTGWNKASSAKISATKKGWNSLKALKIETTSTTGTYQWADQKFILGQGVQIGHKYYTSERFKIENEDDSGIKVYAEIVYQNSSGTYKGTLGNYFKTNTTRTGNWQFGSFVFTPVANEEYYRLALRPLITNNIQGVSASWADSVLLLDLTEIYGSGNEPTKEWCDQNISYFDGTWIVPRR